MKRYIRTSKFGSVEGENEAIDRFLAEIDGVCKKHGFSISHEDGHGGFLVVKYDDYYRKWLFDAADETQMPK